MQDASIAALVTPKIHYRPSHIIVTYRELRRWGWTDQQINDLTDLIAEEESCFSPSLH